MDGFTRFGSMGFPGARLDATPAEHWVGTTATAYYTPIVVPPLRYPRDLPRLNAEWVRRMLSDSAVQLALAARKAPLLSVEFAYQEQGRWLPGVRASDPAIGQFVHRQLQRLWKRGIARLLDSAQIWGWGAGEVTFRRTQDAQLEVDQILVRNHEDVRPVVQDGTIIGVEFRRLQKSQSNGQSKEKIALAFPRAIWHAHHPQAGQWFGWTVLAAAFSPWWDKHGSGGALDVRRLFMTKDGYRGTRIYYPSGTSTVQQPDGSIKQVPNHEIAMQIVETIRTGGVFALPSEVDANGTPRWKVEESQVSNNPSHILQYPKELDAEILNAMGIADDVLKSEATGSWAGKAVPQQATYCILEQWLSDLICDVDRVIEKLVEINFGPGHQYEITTRPLADQMLAQQNGSSPPAGPKQAEALQKRDPSQVPRSRAPQLNDLLRMGLDDESNWQRMGWNPNQPRAPKDGVWIKGVFYEGGEFIPVKDFNEESPEERRIFEEKWKEQNPPRYGEPGGAIGPPTVDEQDEVAKERLEHPVVAPGANVGGQQNDETLPTDDTTQAFEPDLLSPVPSLLYPPGMNGGEDRFVPLADEFDGPPRKTSDELPDASRERLRIYHLCTPEELRAAGVPPHKVEEELRKRENSWNVATFADAAASFGCKLSESDVFTRAVNLAGERKEFIVIKNRRTLDEIYVLPQAYNTFKDGYQNRGRYTTDPRHLGDAFGFGSWNLGQLTAKEVPTGPRIAGWEFIRNQDDLAYRLSGSDRFKALQRLPPSGIAGSLPLAGHAAKNLFRSARAITNRSNAISSAGDVAERISQSITTLDESSNLQKATNAPAPPPRPRAYSTALEIQLKSRDLGRSRSVHFNRCNAATEDLMNSDPHLAQQLEELIPGIRDAVRRKGGRQTPAGWIWEHASKSVAEGREGVMRLVPTEQHTPGSPWWRKLHPDPGAAGGYSEWAIPRGAPKNK